MKYCFFCERASLSFVGIEYLISVLRNNGYNLDVVFDHKSFKTWETSKETTVVDDDVAREILNTNCDVIFSYINTTNFQRISNIFTRVKKMAPEKITCVGGPHATYSHRHAVRKDCIDYVCRGEGELAILEFIDLVEGRREDLPSGIYRMNGDGIEGVGFGALISDLDSLPYPDKSDYYQQVPQVRGSYMIMSGRGCPNKCTFCNSPTIQENYRGEGFNFMRRRSVDDVIGELKLAKDAYGPMFVWFCDDTFIYNKKYMAEFARRYSEEIGTPFGCSSIPNFFDEEIINALVSAGLSNVEVGIQTLNPETRINVLGRRETNEEFARFVKMLTSRGVYVNTDHIVNPWDSRENLKEQIALYSEIQPTYINVFHLQYFPDTRIIDIAIAHGHISKEEAEVIGNGMLNTYFSGGSISEDIDTSKDLVILLSFTPFLPSGLVKWILGDRLLWLFRLMPMAMILLLRAFSAMLRKADFSGRSHLKTLLYSLIKYIPKADPRSIADIRAISQHKTNIVLRPASLLRNQKNSSLLGDMPPDAESPSPE